ncbi:MAG: hypothetical protein JF593_06655 [Novosphingobium sp.]|nr:hypothetical protein [Novosphingobium sp.]
MSLFSDPRFVRACRVAFFIALVFAMVMALLPKPPHLPIDRFGDKFEHILGFSVLAGLGVLSFPAVNRWRIAERLSFLGALIEVCQSIPALHRDCDIRDWIADTIAIVVVIGLSTLVLPRLNGRHPAAAAG